MDNISEDEKEKSMVINESKDIEEMDYKEFLNKKEIEENLTNLFYLLDIDNE